MLRTADVTGRQLMNSRIPRGLAAGSAVLAAALSLAGFALHLANVNSAVGSGDAWWVVLNIAGLTVPASGLVIAYRRPQHRIGWLLLLLGFLLALLLFTTQYAIRALVLGPGKLPAGDWAGWVSSCTIELGLSWLVVFLLVFPGGHLPSRRWQGVLRLVVVAALLLTLPRALQAGPMVDGALIGLTNPAGLSAVTAPRVETLRNAGWILLAASALVSVGLLAYRISTSKGEERQQIKWICFALAVTAVSMVVFLSARSSALAEVPIILALNLLPLAVVVAVLRYRLYEIDYVINRTLVYGSLTAVLAGLYASMIQLSRLVFEQTSGIQTDATIVGGALVFGAALFPLKNRVQAVVDRYFGAAPSRELLSHNERLRSVITAFDVGENAREFLMQSVRALGANGGRVYLHTDGGASRIATTDPPDTVEAIRVPLMNGSEEVGFLVLGPRRDQRDFAEADLRVLQSSADLVARAIVLAGRSSPAAAATRPVRADGIPPSLS